MLVVSTCFGVHVFPKWCSATSPLSLCIEASDSVWMVPESVTGESSAPRLADDAQDAILSLAVLCGRLVGLQVQRFL